MRASQKRPIAVHATMTADTPAAAVPQLRPATPPVPEPSGPVPGRAGALIGYARVSTLGQDENLQLDALVAAGVTKVFTDRGVSGSVPLLERPAWRELLSYVRPGDTVVVYRLDRLTRRGLRPLLDVVADLREKHGTAVRSTSEPIDTAGPAGELILAIMGWVAEQEREVLRRRTRDGVAAARARGAHVGRPPADPAKIAAARDLVAAGHSVSRAAAAVGLGRSTLYRELGDER